MPPQVELGKVFTVTCADVTYQQMADLQRKLPSFVKNWLEFYLPTITTVERFFISSFYIPQMDPGRCKLLFSIGGSTFAVSDRHFIRQAYTLANRLDEELKRWVRNEFGSGIYIWCLPQFNQFEFN